MTTTKFVALDKNMFSVGMTLIPTLNYCCLNSSYFGFTMPEEPEVIIRRGFIKKVLLKISQKSQKNWVWGGQAGGLRLRDTSNEVFFKIL